MLYGKSEDMKELKKIKLNMWINAILTVFIGVLFIVKPHDSLKVIAVLAGILILCSGIFSLVYNLKARRNTYFAQGALFEGILKCILGIFIITHAGITMVLLSYVFSIFVIINGAICMETAVNMKKIFHIPCGLYIFLSCMVILAGITMMFFAPDTVSTAALMAGIIFILNGCIDMFMIYRLSKMAKKFALEVKEVFDEVNGNIIDE